MGLTSALAEPLRVHPQRERGAVLAHVPRRRGVRVESISNRPLERDVPFKELKLSAFKTRGQILTCVQPAPPPIPRVFLLLLVQRARADAHAQLLIRRVVYPPHVV